jgi:hypothetical protein
MAYQSYEVDSSAIAALQYDPETQYMSITFSDGRSYVCINVPEVEVERLVNSDSPGAYWNANMRGKYY